jgi:hypothetical protein
MFSDGSSSDHGEGLMDIVGQNYSHKGPKVAKKQNKMGGFAANFQ